MSRTLTFGESGVSASQFYTQYLATVKLNSEPVDWAGEDLSYLQPAAWAADFAAAVAAAAPQASLDAFFEAACGERGGDVKWGYGALGDYPAVAARFGFIDDAKAGVPRTAFSGVVTVAHKGCRKFAVPGRL